MTTAADAYADENDDEGQENDQRSANREGFERRKRDKEQREQELAELREFKATVERREALNEAKDTLKAEGPLGAFLKTYTGDPTAEAIRKAVADDADFRDLVTFPPDPRDEAAAAQAGNAAKMRGGDPVGATTPKSTGFGKDRIAHHYAATGKKT